MLAPEALVSKTIIWACKSVAKPGKGRVATSTPVREAGSSTRTLMPGEPGRAITSTPMSRSLSSSIFRCSGMAFVTVTSPPVAAVAIKKVPASIRSGITVHSVGWSSSTPSITMRPVPAPMTRAPIEFKKLARAEISGFAGAVLDDGDPIGEHRSHHDVLGRPDARVLEGDLRGLQSVRRAGLYEAVVELDVGAERAQAVDVKVELPQAQVAAAGRGDLGLPEARHERAEDDQAGAHLAHQLVGGRVGVLRWRRLSPGCSPKSSSRRRARRGGRAWCYVFDAGDVVQRGLARREERGGDELQGGVLRPRDLDLTLQTFTTLDVKSLRHGSSPVRVRLPVRSFGLVILRMPAKGYATATAG